MIGREYMCVCGWETRRVPDSTCWGGRAENSTISDALNHEFVQIIDLKAGYLTIIVSLGGTREREVVYGPVRESTKTSNK